MSTFSKSAQDGFTTWLRQQGLGKLAPDDDEPRPLTSRIALLIDKGFGPEEVEELCLAWGEWKVAG